MEIYLPLQPSNSRSALVPEQPGDRNFQGVGKHSGFEVHNAGLSVQSTGVVQQYSIVVEKGLFGSRRLAESAGTWSSCASQKP